MPAVLYPPPRPQTIGEVLDSTFRICRSTLLRSVPFGVLAIISGQLQNIYDILRGRPLHQFGHGDPVWWTLYGVGIFVAYAFINAILLRQEATISGRPASARGALTAGLRKAPASSAFILLIALAIGVCFLPALIPLPRRVVTIELLILAVPACYVAVLLSCSWTTMLIGNRGIFASLRYSARLVRGHWWRTTTIYLVAFAMLGVLFVSSGVVGYVLALLSGGDVAVTTALSTVMVVAMGAIYVPFFTAMALALYGDLEARREVTDPERRLVGAAAG
jgi:hypothetical protein